MSAAINILNRLHNYSIIVHTKSGQEVRGTLIRVEPQLNLKLRDVVVTERNFVPGSSTTAALATTHAVYTVRGSSVRTVSIPPTVNVNALVVAGKTKVNRHPRKDGSKARKSTTS